MNPDQFNNQDKLPTGQWRQASGAWSGQTVPTPTSTSAWGVPQTESGTTSAADTQSENQPITAFTWGVTMAPIIASRAPVPISIVPPQPCPRTLVLQGPPYTPGIGSYGPTIMGWNGSYGIPGYYPMSGPPPRPITAPPFISSHCPPSAGTTVAPGAGDLAMGFHNLTLNAPPPPDLIWNLNSGDGNGNWASLQARYTANQQLDPPDVTTQTQREGNSRYALFHDSMIPAKEEEVRRAVNSNEGWGTTPVCQDTPWDINASGDETEKNPPPAWNTKGTDIWENTRKASGSGVVAAGAAGAAGTGMTYADKAAKGWNASTKPSMGGDWNQISKQSQTQSLSNPLSSTTSSIWGAPDPKTQDSRHLWGASTGTSAWEGTPAEEDKSPWKSQELEIGVWENPEESNRRVMTSNWTHTTDPGNSSGMDVTGNGNGNGKEEADSSAMATGGAADMQIRMGGASGTVPSNPPSMPIVGGGMRSGMNMAPANMGMMMGGLNVSGNNNNGSTHRNGMNMMYWNMPPVHGNQGWNPQVAPPPPPQQPLVPRSNGPWTSSSAIGNPAVTSDGGSVWTEPPQNQGRGWGGAMWTMPQGVGVPPPPQGVPRPSQGLPQVPHGVPQPPIGVPQPPMGVPQPAIGVPQAPHGVAVPQVPQAVRPRAQFSPWIMEPLDDEKQRRI